jgi:hypothetical protein
MRYMDLMILIQIRETIEDIVGDGNYFCCCYNGTRRDIGRDNIKKHSFLRFWMTSDGAGVELVDEEVQEKG